MTSTVSYRSNPSRPCRRAAAPWDTAVTPGESAAAIARPSNVTGDATRGEHVAGRRLQRAGGQHPELGRAG